MTQILDSMPRLIALHRHFVHNKSIKYSELVIFWSIVIDYNFGEQIIMIMIVTMTNEESLDYEYN